MLFSFLKYLSPIWYFNLRSATLTLPYFVDYRKLDRAEQSLLNLDTDYITEKGFLADAAYQALQKGIMKNDAVISMYNSFPEKTNGSLGKIKLFEGCEVTITEEPFVEDIHDNYRFIRRFFNQGISWYILFLRLLSLHNPVREISGFIAAAKVKRINLYGNNAFLLYEKDYDSFDSPLIKRSPKISVIIPTLNRYTYLRDVLSDLEKQDYRNFEVIICDQSDNLDDRFYSGWNLDMRLIKQREKALWLARNTAVRVAKGDYIAFSEDDVRITPDWLSQHLKCIDFFDSDISAGVFFPEGLEIPSHRSFFRWAEQFAAGNGMVKRAVFARTGLFDRQFEKQRGGDGEFGLRCYLQGVKSISNPFAYCEDVKASTGGLREMGSWDSFRPTRIFAPRPVPSVLYLSRKYWGTHFSLLMLLLSIPGSIVPYQYKAKKWLKFSGYFSLLLIWPVILTQMIISWQKASVKLKVGDLIELFS